MFRICSVDAVRSSGSIFLVWCDPTTSNGAVCGNISSYDVRNYQSFDRCRRSVKERKFFIKICRARRNYSRRSVVEDAEKSMSPRMDSSTANMRVVYGEVNNEAKYLRDGGA